MACDGVGVAWRGVGVCGCVCALLIAKDYSLANPMHQDAELCTCKAGHLRQQD